VHIRPARSPAEIEAAGLVTRAAYAEFAPPPGTVRPGWSAYEAEQADAAGRARDGVLLVAVDPALTVVGTATLYLEPAPGSEHWRPDDAVLRLLAVLPAVRRHGLGSALLRECVRRARAAGRGRLALYTVARMAAAAALYEGAGFVREPEADRPLESVTLLAYALDL